MEQSKLQKMMVAGIIFSGVLSIISIAGFAFTYNRLASNGDKAPISDQPIVVDQTPAITGFIGNPTSKNIATEGESKIIELKGHISTKEIPSFEPISINDKAIKVVKLDGTTKISKITAVSGKAPVVEELTLNNLSVGSLGDVYLARYEAGDTQAAASALDIYIGFQYKGVSPPSRK